MQRYAHIYYTDLDRGRGRQRRVLPMYGYATPL